MILATISATTVVTFVGAAFTTVAAVATIVAVVYARRTVREAHAARTDSHAAHEAEMQQMERARDAAAQHMAQVRELQVAAAAAYSAHEEQMRQQEAVFKHDLMRRTPARELSPSRSLLGDGSSYPLRTRSRSQAATTACWRACSRRDFSRERRWAPADRCVSVNAAAHSGCLTDIDRGEYGAVARGESGIDKVLSSQGRPVWTLRHSGLGHYVTAIGKPPSPPKTPTTPT